MRNRTVRTVVDLSKPPVITDEMRANLEEISKIRDEDIDLSDMPEAEDSFFANAMSRDEFFAFLKERRDTHESAASAVTHSETANSELEHRKTA